MWARSSHPTSHEQNTHSGVLARLRGSLPVTETVTNFEHVHWQPHGSSSGSVWDPLTIRVPWLEERDIWGELVTQALQELGTQQRRSRSSCVLLNRNLVCLCISSIVLTSESQVSTSEQLAWAAARPLRLHSSGAITSNVWNSAGLLQVMHMWQG